MTSWNDDIREYGIHECKRCTALIATDGRYGRKPATFDADLCEVCGDEATTAWEARR
jgi:RNA polymerase subunit RPABC4/transcription elongation factor Spt4